VTIAVTVLGSSGVYATRERACSGYLLELGGSRLWMDAGTGTWQNLVEHLDYRYLDGIFLSHRHPDHTSDVFQAYHARFWGQPEPLDPIPLWGPEETLERITGFYKDCSEAFIMHAVTPDSAVEIDDARLTFCQMAHPPETLGVRIEHDGAVLAYSADSGPDADFETLAGGAAVFLCEATLQSSDPLWSGHLRASQAGEIAARIGVRKLCLTHLPPHRDLSQSLAEAEGAGGDVAVDLATDGLRLEVPS
jgi:ribonuclease BN (tRNA processing enzyme)